jgi:hypothetical protein
MEFKKEDHLKSLEDIKVPSSLDQFIKDLPMRYQNGEIREEVEQQTEKDWHTFKQRLKRKKNQLIGKRVVALTASLAAGFCLFIGAAFVSPAVAQIASEIPYLSNIFKSKPLMEEIEQVLNEKGITHEGFGVSISEKEIYVKIKGPESYYRTVKQPTEEAISEILKYKNFDAYSIKVTHGNSPEEEELQRQFREVEEKSKEQTQKLEVIAEHVYEILAEFGYGEHGVGVREDIIHLDYILTTDTRVEEMKARIIDRLAQEGYPGYKVKVYLYDPSLDDRGERFSPLFHTMSEGLTSKKEFKVDLVGFTNKHKDRFYISVQTSIQPSDRDKEETLDKIEKAIRDFLLSEEALAAIQNDQYEIVIHSKKQKEELRVIKSKGLQ